MSTRLHNAKALYLEGIRDGNVRAAVTRYTGARYTQHSTGVADGIEGFVEFFDDFVRRNPVRDIQIVRELVDGRYVFLQAYQDINNGEAQWITTDLFDTDEDERIIEHWDVIAPARSAGVSGRTQLDGPTEIKDLKHTERNKDIVRRYLANVCMTGNYQHADRYVSGRGFAQHSPDVRDGLEGLRAHAANLEAQGRPLRYLEVFKLIGQGNFVVSYSKVAIGTDMFAQFDIFRLASGLIVEHWENSEVVPPPDVCRNSGKF